MQFEKFKKLHTVNAEIVVPALKNALSVADESQRDLIYREIAKVEDCGYYIYTMRCDECGQDHFKGFSRCRSKFCASCNYIKARQWVVRIFQYCQSWLSAGKYIVFLNFTIRDRKNLSEGLNILQGAWREMVNNNVKFRKVFKSSFPGGVRSLEIVQGENSGLWHPHLHCLALKERFSRDTYFLHYAWPLAVQAAGGAVDERNLKILSFKPYDKSNVRDRETYKLELQKSISEVVKYMVKVGYDELPNERLPELVKSTHKVRQINQWGVLYNLKKLVDGDLAKMSESEQKDFVCQVCGCTSGKMNTLAKSMWENEYILDLALKPLDKLPDDYFVNVIKRKNGKLPPLERVNPTQLKFDFDKLLNGEDS